MPEEITGSENLQHHIDAHLGYLAHKKTGQLFYIVHDLGAFCKRSIDLLPGKGSTYYADDTGEFTQMWSAMDWIECANCRHLRLQLR